MRRMTLFLALLLAFPVASFAQTDSIDLTVFAGYRSGGDFIADPDLFDRFVDEFEVDDADVYGLALGIPISRSFAVELLYSRQETELSFDDGFFVDPVFLSDIEVSYFHAGMRWQWAPGQVQPYVAAGLGVARLSPDDALLDTEHRFSGSLGAGVRIMPTDHVGLRLEARGYFTDLSDYDDRRCCRDDYDNGDLYQVEATAGIVFAF